MQGQTLIPCGLILEAVAPSKDMVLTRTASCLSGVLLGLLFTLAHSPEARSREILHVGSALDEDITGTIFAGFERSTGIRVINPVGRKSTGEWLHLIKNTRGTPPVSLVLGGSVPHWISAKEMGLLERYRSPLLDKIEPRYYDPEYYWTGIYVGAIGFATNTSSSVPPPTSWRSLLGLGLHRRIVMPNPSSSGTGYIILTGLVSHMGEDRAFSFLQRLHGQVVRYTTSGPGAVKQAAKGLASVGLGFAHDIIKQIRKGAPLKLSFPTDGTAWEIGCMIIPKGGPQRKLARRFADYLLGVEGQSLFASTGSTVPLLPVHPNARVASDAVPLDDLVLWKMDFLRSGKDQKRLVAKWNRSTLLSLTRTTKKLSKTKSPFGTFHPGPPWIILFASLVLALILVAALSILFRSQRRLLLRSKFIYATSLSVATTAAILAIVMVYRQYSLLLNERVHRASLLSRLFAEQCADPLISSNYSRLKEMARHVARQRDVSHVAVFDVDGSLLLAYDVEDPRSSESRLMDRSDVLYTPPSRKGSSVQKRKAAVLHYRNRATGDTGLRVDEPIIQFDRRWGSVRVHLSLATVFKAARKATYELILAMAFIMFLGVLLSVFLVRRMVLPFKLLQERMGMAEQGDLTVRMDEEGLDEQARLARSFNKMLSQLERMFLDIRRRSSHVGSALDQTMLHCQNIQNGADRQVSSARDVNSSVQGMSAVISSLKMELKDLSRHASKLSSFIDVTSRNIDEIDSRVRHMEASVTRTSKSVIKLAEAAYSITSNAGAMERSVADTSMSAELVVASIREMTSRALEATKAMESAQTKAEEGRLAISSSLLGMRDMTQILKESVSTMQALGQSSEEIADIISIIRGFAEKTNLLALNASIIAAQAGEYGRSFSVVASEIQMLAERSDQATRRTVEIIETIRARVKKAAQVSERGSLMVEGGMKMSDTTARALGQILEGVETATSVIGEIAEVAVRGERNAQDILATIDQVKMAASRVTISASGQNKDSASIASEMETIDTVAHAVTKATEEQRSSFSSVKNALSAVEKSVMLFSRSEARQAQTLDRILDDVEEVQAIAHKNRLLTNQMVLSAQALGQEERRLMDRIAGFKIEDD